MMRSNLLGRGPAAVPTKSSPPSHPLPVAVLRTAPLAIAGAAAVLGLVAAVQPMLALGAAIGIAFAALMLSNLAVGLCLFAFSASFFEAVPELGTVSLAKAVGLVLVVSWLASEAVRDRQRRQLFSVHPGLTVLLALLLTWCVLTVLWAENGSTTLSNCLRLGLNLLLVPIAYAAIDEPRHVRWLIGSFLAGVVGSTLYGLLTGIPDTAGGSRLSGAGLDPNYLALWLVVAAALAAGLVLRRRALPEVRMLVGGAMLFCAYGLVETASRGGLLALAVVFLAAPMVAGPRRRMSGLLVSALAASACVLYIALFAPSWVTDHIKANDGGSGRTDIWRVALRMVDAHPAQGVGLGNFRDTSVHFLLEPGLIRRSDHIVDQRLVVHNIYLELLAETGAIGLGLYLAVAAACVLAAARAARRFARARLREEDLLARCVLLGMIALLAGTFFVSAEYMKALWLVLALGPALLRLSARATGAESGT